MNFGGQQLQLRYTHNAELSRAQGLENGSQRFIGQWLDRQRAALSECMLMAGFINPAFLPLDQSSDFHY